MFRYRRYNAIKYESRIYDEIMKLKVKNITVRGSCKNLKMYAEVVQSAEFSAGRRREMILTGKVFSS